MSSEVEMLSLNLQSTISQYLLFNSYLHHQLAHYTRNELLFTNDIFTKWTKTQISRVLKRVADLNVQIQQLAL